MTVPVQGTSSSYTANGITTVFALAAKTYIAADLKVYLNGVLQTGGYTVSGYGNDAGVSVTFSSAPTSGTTVLLRRELELSRATDYPFGGNLSSDVLDVDQDRQTMMMQQIDADISSAATFPDSYSGSTLMPLPTPETVIGWNSGGSQLINYPLSSAGVVTAADVAFTPSGTISSATVQAAIEEVAAEAGGANAVTSIKAAPYNAVGDGVTDDSAAFTVAEASAVKVFFLPAGTYKVNGVTLTKRYYGEGRLFLDGEYYGQEYSSITTAPLSVDAGNYGIDGDVSHVQVGSYRLAQPTRNGLSQPYFNAPTTPFFNRYRNYAGNSGIDCRLSANATAGATSVVVNAVPSIFVNGTQIGLTGGANPGGVAEVVTISGVVGNTVSFSPALAYAYASGDKVTANLRTMNQLSFSEVDHFGGGDAYCWTGRVAAWGTSNRHAGQDHFFATSTAGIIGGDLYGGEDGVYLTGTEFNLLDTTYLGDSNISAIGHVNSFQRSTDPRSYLTTTLASSAGAGAVAISVASAAGWLASGGTVTIYGVSSTETAYIASVSGTTVNLLSGLNNSYSSGADVIYQAQALRTTLSSGASAGATSIVVASASGITAGASVITVTQGKSYSVNTVSNVSGTTITLGNTLGATFTSGASVAITNNSIAPYGATWIGSLFKSEAAKPCDAATSVIGKWKTGLNLTLADFSSFSQAAIQMASGHRIYFNSYYAADVGAVALWGNIAGDTYMTHSPYQGTLQTYVGNALISEASRTSYIFRKAVDAGAGLSVPINAALWFGGIGSGSYWYNNGSYLYYRTGGVDAVAINATNTFISNTVNLNGIVNFFNPTNNNTASAGGANALPAAPYTYLTISINGTPYKIPVYNT